MATDFLASTNHFLYIFSETPAGESFFSVYWKLIFERILHSGYWRRIFLSNGDRYFTWKFSSTSENRHYYESKPIFKNKIYSCRWKLIFWLVETVLFIFLFHSIIFYSEFSFLLVKTIIHREAYLKPFRTAIGNHFLWFFWYSFQWKQFFRLIKTYS